MFHFVTDTVSGLTEAQGKAMGIEAVVPSYVRFGDESYRENYDITPEQFHAKLKSDPRFPTTSAPSVGDFVDVFSRFKGDSVICVNVSRELSGTVSAAENAAQETGGDIVVIDSRFASAGQVLLLQEAIKLANEGKSSAEIKVQVEALIPKMKLHLVVDTLENLKRGGRIGGARALIGGMLNVKPILTIKDGRLAPLEQVRTKGKAVARVVEMITQDLAGKSNAKVIVIHAAATADAQTLANELKAKLNLPSTPMIIEVGASVAAHAGPGAVGAAYLT
jgi:DegV family protein with EDD domain